MAQLKNTTINDTGFLKLPIGTRVQRPTSPIDGDARYNSTLNLVEIYSSLLNDWISAEKLPIVATGGDISFYTENGKRYKIHTFKSTASFTVLKGGEVEYLVVGGGGGGGAAQTVCTGNWHDGGGGGAGGVVFGTTSLETGAYTMTVGSGGAGAQANQDNFGAKGQNSSIGNLVVALGGGGGETRLAQSNCGGNPTAMDGASGGGRADGAGRAGFGTPGQGFNGGIGGNSDTGGGGGGAGSLGLNLRAARMGGEGGQGIYSKITGETVFYGGGGGGGRRSDQLGSPGAGGAGGGGAGGEDNSYPAENGESHTGGGGGGGSASGSSGGNAFGGAGGSGIIVVRYEYPMSDRAIGGIERIENIGGVNYKLHIFKKGGTFKVFENINAAVLLVGGGGSGGTGGNRGNQDTGKGGGGAGGVLVRQNFSIAPNSYPIKVGAGGIGGGPYWVTPNFPGGVSGEDTEAFGVTAKGGGRGGASDTGSRSTSTAFYRNEPTGPQSGWPQSGGSGGGGGARNANNSGQNGFASNQPSFAGWTSYGNSGGNSGGNGNFGGGGGGGAGAAGGTGQSNQNNSLGGNGGSGINLSSIFGTNVGDDGWFAGGGGGGGYSTTTNLAQSSGGQGGGGRGVFSREGNNTENRYWRNRGIHGMPSTGGGGGGASESEIDLGLGAKPGSGGGGIVIIRYQI